METIYVVNERSGEVHRGARLESGIRLTGEQCQVDDMKEWIEVEEGDALRRLSEKPDLACGHCLGGVHDKDSL